VEPPFVLTLSVATSIGTYVFGAFALGLSARGLATAVRKTLESVGLTVVFLVVNVALGSSIVLATRPIAPEFSSVYVVDDVTLLVLSLLQGLLFQWWREPSVSSRVTGRP
jgi:hypothetical protein